MKNVTIILKGINIIIKIKGTARVWEIQRKENWENQVIDFFLEEKLKSKIEFYLGEEFFKISRIKLESGEILKERIEEEQQESLEKRVWRWIEIDKSDRNYLLISMAEREIENFKKIFSEIGQEIVLIGPEFLKEKKINFIKVKNKRIILILVILILEALIFVYFSCQENIQNRKLINLKGKNFELKKQIDELEKNLKSRMKNTEDKNEIEEILKIELVIKILETLPSNIYLEHWSLENSSLKLQGIGKQEEIYELERNLLKQRLINWIEVGYIKKSKKGYEFLIEIFF
jgi:cell division protein FtsL